MPKTSLSHPLLIDVVPPPASAANVVGQDVARRITWIRADLLTWEPPVDAYDLICSHFIHFVSPQRENVFRRLAAAVKPNGTLLIVAHHPSDLQTMAKRWRMPEFFYTAEEVAAILEPERGRCSSRKRGRVRSSTTRAEPSPVHDSIVRALRR